MPRPLPLLLLALLALPAAGLAQTRETRAALEANLGVERRLLARDLAAHRQARERERREQARADEAAGRIEAMLAGESLTLAALERQREELAAARAGARAAGEAAGEVLGRVVERLRRIEALEEELGRRRGNVPDPLSGRWRVRFQPGDQGGTFLLRLDGTLVSGEYELAGGAAGSLRGTLVDNVLRVDQIDGRTGLTSQLIARLDPAAGTLAGSWHATELAAGEPSRGDWSGVRLPAQPR